ncbi:MAG: formimidoylglutamate deiminase [Bacteroidia bacterium]
MKFRYKRFKGLLTEKGMSGEVWIELDDKGRIVETHNEKPRDGAIEYIEGYAIPGFQNAHSHAFQYAMAGLAEIHSTSQTPDDFWSWREAMYNIALGINPEQMEAIATMLYSEMVRHGYTSVAEFHYVHHDKNGEHYGNLAEMGERLINAAKTAGIKITLVPMFYKNGGFGKAATEGQRRFLSKSVDEYQKLLEATEQVAKNHAHANVGFGFHSLRAVDKDAIQNALQFAGEKPIHIHIAEQLKEIEDSIAFSGKRPVEWLYENADVNESWHLVHATHLSDTELSLIAKSKANAVLCPTTEGNLGDGIFRLREFIAQNGNWSIGTDSHIGIDPKEELRVLDYGQRLISHKRNSFYTQENGDSGLFGYKEALISGRKAMGNNNAEYFKKGELFDAVILDANYPLIATSSLKKVMSTYIYSGDATANLGTMVNGEWMVKFNHHNEVIDIRRRFAETLKEMAIR